MIHALLAMLIIHVGVNFVGWSLSGSQPVISTTLSAGITASDTSVPVDSTSGFPSAGWLYVEGEAIEYTGTTSSCPGSFAGQPACFTGATRGGQETTGISHAVDSIVYNEASGLVNDLAGFESRTSVDELGQFSSPLSSGSALLRFLGQAATWDWPMFDGDLSFLRVIGGVMTTAIIFGIGISLFSVLSGSIRRVI